MVSLVTALLVLGSLASRAESGTWTNNGSGNWSDTTRWLNGVVADGTNFTANFNTINISANRTVTVDTPRTISDILTGDTSGSQNWTFSGANVLTLANETLVPQIRVLQNTATFNVVLDGVYGLRKEQAGTLVLNAANTYSGGTFINRGTLRLGNAAAIPSGAGKGDVTMTVIGGSPTLDLGAVNPTINGLNSTNATVTINSSAAAGTSTLTVGGNDASGAFAGVIANGASRTLALTKTGAGTQSLSGINTYSGATTISGGTLQLTGDGAIASSSTITLAGGATFDVSGVNAPPYVITSSQTLISGAGTGTIFGGLTLDASAPLTLTHAAGTPTINVASGTLTLSANATTVIVSGSPLRDGSYKLISKSGSGVVAGTAGSVTVGGAGIAGGGAPSLAISGDELYLNISGGVTAVEWGSGDGTWAVGISGWNSGGGTTFSNGYAALFTDTYATGNPTITLNTEVLPQGVIVSSTNHYTISGTGNIGGTAELRKLGTGVLTLDVTNAHTGGTTLSEGTLNLKNAFALGAASGTFTINGGTLDNTSGGALTLANHPQSWNGNFTFAGTQNLNLGTGDITLTGTRTVTVNAGILTLNGNISGSGFGVGFGLVKAGAGTLELNGDNTFTGGLTINDGEVNLNHDGALNSTIPNTVTFQTDTDAKGLSLNGHSVTIPNLAMGVISGGGATVVRNNHASIPVTLTVDVSSGSAQYAASIADGGAAALALTKTGAGNFTFGGGGVGSGTYSGDTTITAGTLTAGANNIFPHGTGKGNMIVNGTLDILDRSAMALNGLSGNGIVNRSNPGGAPNSTLTVGDGDASAAFSGRIRNTGSGATLNLIKTGAGTQALSGTNDYTGTTTVNAGTLLVNSPGSLAAASAVTVDAGATLGGSGTINGSVTINAGGSVSAGASAGTLTLANGLDLSAGGTNVWELAANNFLNPGTDFDQIVLAGGNLSLGANSVLLVKFTGTATTPDLLNPFWQYPRQWKIIAGNPTVADFGMIDGTNGITAGPFTTAADATGVTLVYTPSVVPPAPTSVTNMTLTPGPDNDYTLTYSGGTGAQFVLLHSLDVATPLVSWDRLATNVAFNGFFTIPVSPEPMGFYRIASE